MEPFYYDELLLIPAWISEHMSYKVWAEITYPISNFIGAAVEVWEWINDFILHFIMEEITCPCWDLKLNNVSIRGHDIPYFYAEACIGV